MAEKRNRYSKSVDIEYMDKAVPRSIEAEQVVLGAVMVDPAAISKAALSLRPESFYLEKHGQPLPFCCHIFRQLLEFSELPDNSEIFCLEIPE